MENIFKQASFTKEVWALAVSVMNLYEEGELKDQTLSTKSLTTKPEFKQQNFSPIQCLPDEFKLEMLSKVYKRLRRFSIDKIILLRVKKYMQRYNIGA